MPSCNVQYVKGPVSVVIGGTSKDCVVVAPANCLQFTQGLKWTVQFTFLFFSFSFFVSVREHIISHFVSSYYLPIYLDTLGLRTQLTTNISTDCVDLGAY